MYSVHGASGFDAWLWRSLKVGQTLDAHWLAISFIIGTGRSWKIASNVNIILYQLIICFICGIRLTLFDMIWFVVWNILYFGNNHPNWLIFFRGVETTNQWCLYHRWHHFFQVPRDRERRLAAGIVWPPWWGSHATWQKGWFYSIACLTTAYMVLCILYIYIYHVLYIIIYIYYYVNYYVILQQCESVDYFLEDDAKILFQVFHQTLLTLLSLNDTS